MIALHALRLNYIFQKYWIKASCPVESILFKSSHLQNESFDVLLSQRRTLVLVDFGITAIPLSPTPFPAYYTFNISVIKCLQRRSSSEWTPESEHKSQSGKTEGTKCLRTVRVRLSRESLIPLSLRPSSVDVAPIPGNESVFLPGIGGFIKIFPDRVRRARVYVPTQEKLQSAGFQCPLWCRYF